MNKIKSSVAYFSGVPTYLLRVNYCVYLADWIACIMYANPITKIKWELINSSPLSQEIMDLPFKFPELFNNSVRKTYTNKELVTIKYKGRYKDIKLEDKELVVIKAVHQKTVKMEFTNLVDYVYSTYPFKTVERNSILDLKQLAKQYKEGVPNEVW